MQEVDSKLEIKDNSVSEAEGHKVAVIFIINKFFFIFK